MSNFLETDVLKAIQKSVIAAVANSFDPSLSIKMVGRTFDPKDANEPGKYLEIVYIPNNSDGEFWGEGQTYRGIFRLILHFPNDDAGAYPPMILLGSICNYFTKDILMVSGPVSVKITSVPSFTGDLASGHETLYPVSIRYLSFQP